MVPPATDEMVAEYRSEERLIVFSCEKIFFVAISVLFSRGERRLSVSAPSVLSPLDIGVSLGVSPWFVVGGEVSSIYFGVKTKTNDIKKNARSVFLSTVYITGSSPPLNRGLHFSILITIRYIPFISVFFSRASMA